MANFNSKIINLAIFSPRWYKKIVKHKVENSEDINDIDSSCTNDESESDTSYNDQDSDVSFEIDNDEEIDAAEIEEEEWVEFIERSTIEVMEKMENEKIRCWKIDSKKNEVESGDENRNITEREVVDQSC